jgi:hypothetical protein
MTALLDELDKAVLKIDRPGTFCVSGSAPTVLPGLEVEGLGPVGLPLTDGQAQELKGLCEQAPYGKGEETVVDTSVRRVWRLPPERFALKGPDWPAFLQETVRKVREELGLEGQKLEGHLYDLLLYEPGSFFLPHRDGEKLERMVATLLVVLPSSFEGGELVVRHEGQEQTVDFGAGGEDKFRTHYAAFYADCEHEVRPLRKGHRLTLVYNLTLKKGKKGISAPRTSQHVETVSRLLGEWAKQEGARKLVVLLEHQYTEAGLAWDALKGADRAKGQVLIEAAQRAGCQAYLALVTLHEAGSAEGGYGGGYGRRYGRYRDYDDDPSNYEMGEVYETSLTAEHWRDSRGNRPSLGPIALQEEEVLGGPDALRLVDPEEEFEGYTGNAGMTLDRWYRHAAIVLWPEKRRFDALCDGGLPGACEALAQLVKQWQRSGKKAAADRKAECLDLAATIERRWPERAYRMSSYGGPAEAPDRSLLQSVTALDDPGLIEGYLSQVLARDASADPGASLVEFCRRHGWGAFRQQLEAVFEQTTEATLERNVRLLERVCLAKASNQEGWSALGEALARAAFGALERIDREARSYHYGPDGLKRVDLLAGLARSLLAAGLFGLLSRVVAHTLAHPDKYPLTGVQVPALTALGPWLTKNVTAPCPSLSNWIASCCEKLEALTARAPEAPTDFRRSAPITCKCADCAELKRFLESPHEAEHRFRVAEARRYHLQDNIRQHRCDLDCKTEKKGSPYSLVCTKNTASYKAKLKQYQEEQAGLAALRSLEASLPK